MNIAAIEKKMGIENMNVFDSVRNVREGLANEDKAIELARSLDLLKEFGITDFESLGLAEDATRARLFATAMVSIMKNNSASFNLNEAIEEARIKVSNVEKMIGSKKEKTKVVKETKPKAPRNEKSVKKSRSAFDLTKARDIFKADPQGRVYDLVSRVAEAYEVDRAKAYGILHRVRKEAA
jgi:hypothetical protein